MSPLTRFLACVVVTLAAPAAAEWKVAQSAHFRVYGDEPVKALTAKAALLEDFRSLLADVTSGQPPLEDAPRLDIFLVRLIATARPFGKVGTKITGFYAASLGRIAAFADTSDSSQAVLLHEYAHHFMLGSSAAAYPAWYVEGFAEYFATAVFRPDRIEFGNINPARALWLAHGKWLPLERLLERDQGRRTVADVSMFYAQSWLLTHYLFRTPGMTGKLMAYLKATSSGADPLTAFKTEIDPDLPGFERKPKTYLNSRENTFTRFNRPVPLPAAVSVTPLDAAADPMLMQLVSLEYGVAPDRRMAAIAAVRAAAARTPGDPMARRTLALLELTMGDHAAAIAQIDSLLAENPKDSTLLRWRAQAVTGDARPTPEARTAARKLLVQSFNADPTDWRTLLAYIRLNDLAAGPLTPTDMDVLLRAYELAPQVAEVVITMAMATAQAGNLRAAAQILEPLAFAPHGSGGVTLALALRARALAGDRAGMVALLRTPHPEAGE